MRWPPWRKDRSEAPAAVRPVDAWTSLPPLPSTCGPIDTTAPTEGFVAQLATQQRPDVAIAPLAHDRSIDARPGIVTGLARPVQRNADGPDMTHARKRPSAADVPELASDGAPSPEPMLPAITPPRRLPATEDPVPAPAQAASLLEAPAVATLPRTEAMPSADDVTATEPHATSPAPTASVNETTSRSEPLPEAAALPAMPTPRTTTSFVAKEQEPRSAEPHGPTTASTPSSSASPEPGAESRPAGPQPRPSEHGASRPLGLGAPLPALPGRPPPRVIQRAPLSERIAEVPRRDDQPRTVERPGAPSMPVRPELPARTERPRRPQSGDDRSSAAEHRPNGSPPGPPASPAAPIERRLPATPAVPQGPTFTAPETTHRPTPMVDAPRHAAPTFDTSRPVTKSDESVAPPSRTQEPTRVVRPAVLQRSARPWPERPSRPQAATPVIGARPPLTSRVQRAPEHVPASVRAMVERATGADLGGVQVHRGPEVSEAAGAMQARAFTAEGQIHLPFEHGPLDAPAVRSLVAHELVHVAQQRRLGGATPSEDSDSGMRLEAEATAIEHATLSPPRAPSPPTAYPSRPSPTPVAQRRAAPSRSSPKAAPAAAPPPPVPVIQRAPEGETPSPEPATPPAPEAPAPAAPAGQGPAELDELARRLYDRIRRRITADLRAGREMAGTIADL